MAGANPPASQGTLDLGGNVARRKDLPAADTRQGTVALLYVRQSNTDPGSASLDDQEAACRRIPEVAASDQVELYRDADISGATEDRRDYQRLLRRIEDGKPGSDVAVVAAYDLSRISRDAEVLLRFHRRLSGKPWITVRFADKMPFGVSAIEKAIYGTTSVFAQLLKDQTAEKIRLACSSLNAAGKATGMAPYGYRREFGDPVNRRKVRFEINEEEAEVVRRLFRDYAQGNTNTRILAGRLNAEGIKKPGSRSKGLGWVPDTIVDILQNVAYVGKTFSISRARR